MDTTFYIVLSVKKEGGSESFGRFYLGNNRDDAYAIFRKLQGRKTVSDKNILFIDFIETVDGLPVNLNMMTCTLEQLAENCKIITKEIFWLNNLEGRLNLNAAT